MLILATDRYLAVDVRGGGSAFMTHVGEARVFLDDLRDDDEAFIHRMTTVLEWPSIVRLDVAEIWPAFTLSWRQRNVSDGRTYEGTAVAELVEHLQREGRSDLIGDRGWLAHPHVNWERVDRWPSRTPLHAGYRSAGTERIVSSRATASWLDKILASETDTVAECLTTDTHLYVRWEDRRGRFRIPLQALRLGLGERDAIYVFGRRTRLVLRHRRKPCEVRAHLDGLLA